MLATADFLEDAGCLYLFLETLQSLFEWLTIFDDYFGHAVFFPSYVFMSLSDRLYAPKRCLLIGSFRKQQMRSAHYFGRRSLGRFLGLCKRLAVSLRTHDCKLAISAAVKKRHAPVGKLPRSSPANAVRTKRVTG